MPSFFQHLQYAARMLRKNPSFSVVAILTLALGIGANATIFSFINALLLRPIAGVERPDQLVGIYTSDYSSGLFGGSSFPDYEDLRQQTNVFTDLAAYDSAFLNLTGSETPERLRASLVTTNYFKVLGVRAHMGRTLREEDDVSGASATAVLSYAFWQRHFGGDRSVFGRSLTLGNKAYTIVGVASESFRGLRIGSQPDVWVRLEEDREEGARGNRGIGITGRLRDNATIDQAEAEVAAIADRLAHAYPQTNMGTLGQANSPRPIVVVPEERIDPIKKQSVRAITTLLFIVVGLVLLIACSNVANLLLARASSRRREIAIRLALGASRWRLIKQLLMESILLALIGGVVALIVTFWTSGFIPAFFPANEANGLDARVDWRVLTFTIGVSLLTGVLFGLAPAVRSSKPALVASLKDENTGAALRLSRFGLRGLLATAQIALSLLLLISAGLFIRSLRNAVTFNPGFDSNNLLVATLATSQEIKRPQLSAFYQEVTENLGAEPGVRSVSFSGVVPLSGGGERRNTIIEGYQPRLNEDIELNTNVVGMNYFDTLGIPIVKGRDFNSGDRDGSPGVVIVNEEFAQRYFSNDTALGKRLRVDSQGPMLEIVGVVRTAKYRNLRESPLPFIYIPLAQAMRGDMTLLVRAAGDPASLRSNVRSVVQRVNHNIPIYGVKTITEQIDVALAADRMMAVLLAVFAATALLLASVGIYGVVSYAVTQRTHEIGIRMALGARPASVLKLVMRDGMKMAIVGVAVGLAGAFAVTRLIDSLLFGVTPTDLPTFVLVTLGLLLVAFLACYLPARRATKVDPLVALRYE
jgi:putative ABC transport system permease protein